ncbi:hypothetical protein P175DRAFT_056832 [Aspergillus ochraceoroseus IBT 24754]|uniref:CHCH domain-containing protein n=1 Tax=Aspergillus ochraceoroseus IBT 24754 TaxID=1392256 RepID=A0A2T5M8T3_9EURO|nr:uncharacterized protein P175DRAFT_056832 [Aspergillus ochraceoroseus IBT 24754]PTU24941.1 hypothetical protein P175DRAFT_056832 [Aspergillus ochraceoroseus IBT 24754]
MASQPDQPSSSTSSSELVPSNAWERVEKKFNHKSASEYYDPCQDYADRSLKCMKRNGFDREMCHDYFQAYRDCKKQWKKLGSSAPKTSS